MLRISIDTDVLIGRDEEKIPERRNIYERLVSLRDAGVIDLGISSRAKEDKANDADVARRQRDLLEIERLTISGSAFRIGVSTRGGPDSIVSEPLMTELYHIFHIPTDEEGRLATLKRTKHHTLWDLDHLYTHRTRERDYFLTYERNTLKRAAKLGAINVRVIDPRDFLAAVDAALAQGARSPDELAALLPAVVDAHWTSVCALSAFRKQGGHKS